ncbi:hypothetical protein SS37A_13660 [Methylocystis iwaonis]|uniref:Uncharacterized protein n=1 Tax=Methylocystis iwaonis TaxID=2885079 RepID=A0ABN6VF53_9HYPH|nr:hypothetical protein SS37A_13660 [Methylocystis iwaonis]
MGQTEKLQGAFIKRRRDRDRRIETGLGVGGQGHDPFDVDRRQRNEPGALTVRPEASQARRRKREVRGAARNLFKGLYLSSVERFDGKDKRATRVLAQEDRPSGPNLGDRALDLDVRSCFA